MNKVNVTLCVVSEDCACVIETLCQTLSREGFQTCDTGTMLDAFAGFGLNLLALRHTPALEYCFDQTQDHNLKKLFLVKNPSTKFCSLFNFKTLKQISLFSTMVMEWTSVTVPSRPPGSVRPHPRKPFPCTALLVQSNSLFLIGSLYYTATALDRLID